MWCNENYGCTVEDGSTIGRYGCQLKQEPRRPAGIPKDGQIVMKPSTFASGYIKRESAGLVGVV